MEDLLFVFITGKFCETGWLRILSKIRISVWVAAPHMPLIQRRSGTPCKTDTDKLNESYKIYESRNISKTFCDGSEVLRFNGMDTYCTPNQS
jgi:hypothetical protein